MGAPGAHWAAGADGAELVQSAGRTLRSPGAILVLDQIDPIWIDLADTTPKLVVRNTRKARQLHASLALQ